ncbi:phenoxazinone synthase [Amycolatopsis rhizosphaerae]|uniref:Phenoxazinone synthase n=1 Tax=Amycolatopsis rhizosphaerae TaxID=2053003 RepID=A0A558ATI9_9PSEU|nr:multicopper oxidase domain-containing protein [Amycolatopsis rhizosphaerae]TVT27570.1 phenoxazinone synthase [Amycolatopsis rhizosphaerae]
MSLTKFADPLRVPPVVRPRPVGESGLSRLTVPMRATRVSLHSELPSTPAWTYAGHLPGPTIEVRRGQPVRIDWRNEITGQYPVTAVIGPEYSQNEPGTSGGTVDPHVAALPPWTVVHLHGGRTIAGSDGWTENCALTGQSQVADYGNDQRASLLWYHDHAMGITRLNVLSGLAGLYVVRDEEEDRLGLPSGRYELPLMLFDRNLGTDGRGRLTGRLLHKTEEGTSEFFAPFTLVNGTIWPYAEVEPRPYRLRLLNAANARVYRLLLIDEQGRPVSEAIRQIGADGGLLPAPVPLPAAGLTLAPAERADLLVDFAALAGRSLRLVNTAAAPFDGAPPAADLPPGVPDPDPDHRLTEPDVLQFRVARGPERRPVVLPPTLSPSFTRLGHDTLPPHEHRTVALVERDMLELWELAELPAGQEAPAGGVTDGIIQVTGPGATSPVTYRRQAASLEDTVNWFVTLDGWEVWHILNLTGDTHPFHVHLVSFQALARDCYDTSGFDPDRGGTAKPVAFTGTGVLDANEQGWKDTIRVNPGEQVTIAARFGGATGRYLYHCHILEHEDNDMMRPFVVLPAAVKAMMGRMSM